MEDCESQSDVQYDPDQSRTHAHVEAQEAVALVDSLEAVGEAVELACFKALHLGLHHVDGVIEHRRAEPSKCTGHEINDHLVGDVVCQELFGIFEDDESNTLIR